MKRVSILILTLVGVGGCGGAVGAGGASQPNPLEAVRNTCDSWLGAGSSFDEASFDAMLAAGRVGLDGGLTQSEMDQIADDTCVDTCVDLPTSICLSPCRSCFFAVNDYVYNDE